MNAEFGLVSVFLFMVFTVLSCECKEYILIIIAESIDFCEI
jgi:hypothetical protein